MIRIVIAEDQEILLGVIGSLLDLEDDLEVVGQAKSGEEAIMLVNLLQPDVCIMDLEMPGMSGFEAADAILPSGCKVIMLTTFAKDGYYKSAQKAGVRGYLLKDSPSEELVFSIRNIMDGKQIFSPNLRDNESSSNEKDIDLEPSNQKMNTTGTVKNYFTMIMDKMKLPTG